MRGEQRMKLTGFGEAETVHSLRQVVHSHILRFAAILEEFLRRRNKPQWDQNKNSKRKKTTATELGY